MAFKLKSRANGEHSAFVYPGTMKANEAGTIYEAVSYDATTGTLTKCAADATPDYILQATVATAATPTVKPPCIKVDEMQEFETTVGTGTDAIVPGTKLTLHTDGLTITTTTTSGVFQVSRSSKAYNAAAATGDVISGFFRR
jgi:hypothetical protein